MNELTGKPVTPKRLIVNACYVFIVLMVSFAISGLVMMVLGWIFPPDSIDQARGDLSYNYYVSYPIRGVAGVAVFFIAQYFLSKTHGYRVAFSLRETMTKADFWIETAIGLVVYTAFIYWVAYDFLPSWFLSGTLAALFKIINASNIYTTVAGGTVVEARIGIEQIALVYYLWIQILLDMVIVAASFFVLRKGRRAGEIAAQEAHEQQLAEMRRDSGLE